MKEINKMKLEKEGQPRELELELEHVEVQEHKFDGVLLAGPLNPNFQGWKTVRFL
ncbi:predicted protein [Sclerotinia sclerotiorum 1980 UF-70]|uniref:Uncharacterized protein n=1 Tax=Sclerotinia sclerotiorum (strain ATCC 18683 / 1980 / Ss-1) TaxID=665079 RepID=A7EYY3_SCLS1|nr:predicted protein [Sclerotinia sclerotiorum 1980 UF-70]EDN94675.1 predicted protein [Sclerotinia sclerotiorum 1980 UF-70]